MRYFVTSEPYGDVAGIYNILAFREQNKVLKDWPEVSQPKRISKVKSAEPKTLTDSKARAELESVFAKRLERPKSPQIHKYRGKATPRSPAAVPKRPLTSYIPVQVKTKMKNTLVEVSNIRT